MSETWNAEKQAYADCEGCHGKGWFDNGAVIVEPCNVCLPRRIAELEAALRPFASMGAMDCTDEELENLLAKSQFPVYMLRNAAKALRRVEGESEQARGSGDSSEGQMRKQGLE